MKLPASALMLLFLICLTPLIASVRAGEATETVNIDWMMLSFEMAGGLALFLYGMDKMSSGMKRTAGNKMRSILTSLTQNRVVALVVGAFVTMVIQSSSATTVMLVSFVQAGLLTLAQSLGVILGADIGTTVTAQMVAFKLTDYALLMLAAGFLVKTVGKTGKIRSVGDIILGFGILFFGMKLMSDAMNPLRSYPPFITLMQNMEHPLAGIAVGAVFTALVQSSSATTGVLIVLAQEGLITLVAGIPVIFGANIGTCVTAVLAGIGASREARRVALAHVLFKIAGIGLFIFWIPTFSELVIQLGAHFGTGTARNLANAHTLLNVTLGLVFLPFTPLFAKLIYRIYPDREADSSKAIKTMYIEKAVLETPSLAIDLARAEMARMAKLLGRMLDAVIIPFLSDERHIATTEMSREERQMLLREIPRYDTYHPRLTPMQGLDLREEKIDFLQKELIRYLTRIAQGNITAAQAKEVFGMMSIVKDMEAIGDTIHRNMMPLIAKKKQVNYDFSLEGKEELLIYHGKVRKQVRLLQAGLNEPNAELALKIMKGERKYLDLESVYRARHLERIILKNENAVETHEIHLELMDLMKQIVLYSAHIAQTYITSAASDEDTHLSPPKQEEEAPV
ncbi:MAG: Na/Pi cotransporter family protein [Desulfobacterales bacterium]|nr:Na/Pi cotransporter family protein [Desulfobacterales bacterium]